MDRVGEEGPSEQDIGRPSSIRYVRKNLALRFSCHTIFVHQSPTMLPQLLTAKR